MSIQQSAGQHSCTVCGSTTPDAFVEIRGVPVHCNLIWPTRAEALNAPKGDVVLGYCEHCGHVFNKTFDPRLMSYTQSYENSLHFSPIFQEFAEDLARRLIGTYDLRGKDIIDVGCGKGDFLRLLCRLGNNRGVGFDPSYVPEPGDLSDGGTLTFVREFYSEKHWLYKADLVSCRQVLEHIPTPREFVATIRRSIGNRPHTALYCEVPNALYTLRDMGIWDIIYEHCSYFSARSLSHLFSSGGFDIVKVREMFGGQYLGLEGRIAAGTTGSAVDEWISRGEMARLVETFGAAFMKKMDEWKFRLEMNGKAGKRTAVWGGGSKGVTFLNMMNAQQHVECMVDINPRKQGRFVAGTGQEIVAPEYLRDHRPDVIIVMNPLYAEEIRKQTEALDLKPECLTA